MISSLPSQIGICDDLILDATSTTNLGGRDNAIFEWTVSAGNVINRYDCNIDSIHEIIYDYDDIYCDIIPNDIVLIEVDPNDLNSFQVELDGDILTYDPNNRLSTDLNWNWSCIDKADESCSYLINTVNQPVIFVDLGQVIFNYSESYLFTLTMEVNDADNLYRDHCIDSIIIDITTKNANYTKTEKLFIVSAFAVNPEINSDDRLRLLGNILNYKASELMDGIITYEWIEVNAELNADQIKENKQTSDNSSNLILKEGTLQSGKQYAFQLVISQYLNEDKQERIGYGISSIVDVYVLQEPKILSNLFVIEPDCNMTYSSITTLLKTAYSLSISAHSDYTPLLYEFGYQYDTKDNEYNYFDSSLLYESSISDVFLPIGDFAIFANVIDSKSSVISKQLQCSITLTSYSECIDFKGDIIDIFIANSMSESQRYWYVYQQSNNLLQYLLKYDGKQKCIQDTLTDIVDLLSVYNALCESSYHVLLSQTMVSLMDFISSENKFVDKFYGKSEAFKSIKDILFSILDPCLYITDNIENVEDLQLSSDSIITAIPRIYYKEHDITHSLSVIITNPHYHHLLYSIASSIIDLFGYLSEDDSGDLSNLLSASLYISELIRVSLSIPGEKTFAEFDGFSIFSVRVNNESVNVSVSNISVFISNDITDTRNGNDDGRFNLFDAVDILVVGINTSTFNNTSTSIITDIDPECDDIEGILSDNSISVTILGNNTNSSHLSSNIIFTFLCNQETGCDESFECVWYNESSDIWQNDGCNKFVDIKKKEIKCSCSHLTTFATIHNIHGSHCDNSYISDWLESDEWDFVNWLAAVLFFMIALYATKEVYPFCRNKSLKWKQKSVFSIILMGITALLYSFACSVSYITSLSYHNEIQRDYWMKIYVLLLLLPQITYFLIFSIIFYTWFVLAHGFIKNIHYVNYQN